MVRPMRGYEVGGSQHDKREPRVRGKLDNFDHLKNPSKKVKERAQTPSRRRPNGLYSVLGVSPTASQHHIEERCALLLRRHNPDRLIGPAKSAATVLCQEILLAQNVLVSESQRAAYNRQFRIEVGDSSTERVQRHRACLTAHQKKLVSAQTSSRSAGKLRHPSRNDRNPLLQRLIQNYKATIHRRCVPSTPEVLQRGHQVNYLDAKGSMWKKGKIMSIHLSNSNNHYCPVAWIAFARPKSERNKDKRLGPYEVVPFDHVFLIHP